MGFRVKTRLLSNIDAALAKYSRLVLAAVACCGFARSDNGTGEFGKSMPV